jgi:CheY-like chemotaxis protein
MKANTDTEHPVALVVDDDIDMALMLGEFVEACGVPVGCVYDLKGCLAALARAPQAVLLDLIMPDECSENAITWLSEHAPETQLILVSSLPQAKIEERAQAARNQGVRNVRYLQKPFWPLDVAAVLKEAGIAASRTLVR